MANNKGNTQKKLQLMKKAYELRIAGLSYRRIGAQLGISYSSAFTYVREIMNELRKECKELAETYRDLELERLDQAQAAIYNKVLQGDVAAIDRLIRIQERRSKLLGLDKPQKQDVNVHMPEPIQFVPVDYNDADKTD